MTTPHENVLTWRPDIDDALQTMGLADRVHPATLLALIHIESHGDPNARRPDSAYHGLLQIAQGYLTDALDYLDHPPAEPAELMSDGRASILVTLAYMARYRDRHGWDPGLMAVAHKGGAGTAKMVSDEIAGGATRSDAVSYAAQEKGLPKLPEYVRKFESARIEYAREVDDYELRACVAPFLSTQEG